MEFFCKYNAYFLNSQQIEHPIFPIALKAIHLSRLKS